MYLSYQVATPDVEIRPSVTSYQGDFEQSIKKLKSYGYNSVELMTRNPNELDRVEIKRILDESEMTVSMVCTGECFGQEGLMLVSNDEQVREKAFKRAVDMIDFASFLNAGVNIGRLRGHYYDDLPKSETEAMAVQVMGELAEIAKESDVVIVLEPVTMLQTNFINSTQDGIDIVRRINHPNFQLMIDIYHSNIEDPDIYKSLVDSKEILGHVHFADNNRRIPGTCGFDFEKIIETLRTIGYTGAVSIEMFQIPDQDTCAIETAKFLLPLLNR